MKIETFLFTHPIRAVIQDQKLQFGSVHYQGILFQLEREFECGFPFGDHDHREATNGHPDSIARSLHYDRLATHDRPYPLKAITEFDANMFITTKCTNPTPMGGFLPKEFIPG